MDANGGSVMIHVLLKGVCVSVYYTVVTFYYPLKVVPAVAYNSLLSQSLLLKDA